MDKQTTIWLVIGVYAVFMLAVGILYSRKGTDMAGFTVGGRSAGAWISALSYGTAYFSAVMFIGYSGGSGWSYGLWSVLVGLGNAVFGSLLAWLVLADRTRAVTRRFDIKSMPQLFEKRFQSPGMRLFSCIVIFVFLIPYSASVYKGLTSVCSVILGIDSQVCMIIIAIASAMLLVLGGYIATLKADFVQGFVMMAGVTALIVLVVLSPQVGGLGQGLSRMADYMKNHEMDGSRCVACMDCVNACNEGAIKYTFRYGSRKSAPKGKTDTFQNTSDSTKIDGKASKGSPADQGRRAFIVSSAIAASTAALKAQEMKTDGGLSEVRRAQLPSRKTPLVPAGAISLKHFKDHCTACQLCVSSCPNNVLRPSASLMTLMQPEMSYERGYCRPECTACSEVCPAGAIIDIDREEKSAIQIGHASVDLNHCVVNTDNVSCGNCARHCPAGAIRMVRRNPDDKNSLRIPTVNEERCIGCGACENLCPARPLTAIHVEGHEVHRTI